MKTFTTLAFATAFAISSLTFAEANSSENVEPETISQTVAKLLSNPELNLSSDEDAIIELFINKKNEIVVLSVDTENRNLERFIKSRLNYEKLRADLFKNKTYFKIPLKFTELN